MAFKLIFEKWDKPFKGTKGTIRTTPENYYVATVRTNGSLMFSGIEANTRNIDKAKVKSWWNSYKLKAKASGWKMVAFATSKSHAEDDVRLYQYKHPLAVLKIVKGKGWKGTSVANQTGYRVYIKK